MRPTFYTRIGKLLFDRSAALVALALLWPILAIVAIAVRLSMGSPILFRQERPGRQAKPFTILKYRSMSDARDSEGRLLADKFRLTRVGAFLRRTSLDELPELINVLRGEMSLVGPRPLLMKYLDLYSAEQFRRHEVKPGITGWAQINGRNTTPWGRKLEMDVWYCDHVSFTLDLRILLITVWKFLKREGINEPGQATVREFTGEP